MQSLGAIAHFDFNASGAHSYEQALLVIRRLGLSMNAVEEQYRRMVFNICARNQDDHVKNIAFLMDRAGNWSLAPAFDLTYAWQPTGRWTSVHQMTLNGKRDGFTLADFDACARQPPCSETAPERFAKRFSAPCPAGRTTRTRRGWMLSEETGFMRRSDACAKDWRQCVVEVVGGRWRLGLIKASFRSDTRGKAVGGGSLAVNEIDP